MNEEMNERTEEAEGAIEPPACDAENIRQQRIVDYVTESLAKNDLLEANLGAVNGDLMLIAYRLQAVLGDVLQRPPESLVELSELMPAIDGYLRVTKQVERYSQLALKMKRGDGR